MKLTIILIAVLGYSALLLTNFGQTRTGQTPQPSPVPPVTTPSPAPAAATPSAAAPVAGAKEPCEDQVQASGIPLCSRVEPKTIVLGKDSVQNRNYKTAVPPSTPIEAAPFTHETHATLKYSIDGTQVIGCAECHHTDQPKASLSGLLKTSERSVVLTTANLSAPGAKPVLSCRACHAQEGVKPKLWPESPKIEDPDQGEVTLINTDAYHRNCISCHESSIAARKKPGAPKFIKDTPPTSCTTCHTVKVR